MLALRKSENFERKSGFFVGYLIFTTVLFFVLILIEKIPDNWNYLHIAGLTFVFTISGMLLKGVLK